MTLTKNDFERKLEVASSSSELSSEEAFVMSRLSSPLKLRELLSMLPWAESEALSHVTKLIEKRQLRWIAEQNENPPSSTFASAEFENQLKADETHPIHKDLDRQLRLKILNQLKKSQSENPFEVLGIELTASEAQIKNRYLELSRDFHHDRYFRKDLGDYSKHLDKIFSRIQKSYASIKNSHDRDALARKHRSSAASSNHSMDQLKIDPLLKKIADADQHYKKGIEAQKNGEMIAAYNEFLLASQLNPKKEDFKKSAEIIRPLVLKEKAKSAVERAEGFLKVSLLNDALSELKTALKADPDNGRGALLMAKTLLELDEKLNADEAQHLLKKAKIKSPTDPEPCLLLANLYQMQRSKSKANSELQEALRRDPENMTAKKLLNKL